MTASTIKGTDVTKRKETVEVKDNLIKSLLPQAGILEAISNLPITRYNNNNNNNFLAKGPAGRLYLVDVEYCKQIK